MPERWRVAVLDSGLAGPDDGSLSGPATGGSRLRGTLSVPGTAGLGARGGVSRQASVVAIQRFVDSGRDVLAQPAIADPIGHGTTVAEIISGGPAMELLVGQVLDSRGCSTAASVAAAITWSMKSSAHLIHMSLGLREDRRILAGAVTAALAAGCIVVASAPARGLGIFPSSYPHVIRATGDARCGPDEVSHLDNAQADFGARPRYGPFGGASIGAAHLTRFLVSRVAPGSSLSNVRTQLVSMARYRGAESCSDRALI